MSLLKNTGVCQWNYESGESKTEIVLLDHGPMEVPPATPLLTTGIIGNCLQNISLGCR